MMGIGVMELLIIGLIGLLIFVPLVLVVVVVVVAAASRKQGGPAARPDIAPCPKCQQLVGVQAKFCPECGQPLK